jgi:Tol biopolymer transport system component
MKRCALVILAITLAAGGPAAQDLERLFKAAVNTETVDRNCRAAIEQYKVVAAGSNRELAAEALLRTAGCHEQLGDPEARKIYQRIANEFADQREHAAIARERLTARQTRAVTGPRSLEPRVLCEQCGGVGAVSRDGRWFVVSNVGSAGDIERRDLTSDAVERMRARASGALPAQGGSQAYWPILSADSRQIAYAFNPGSRLQDPTLLHARLMVMPNQPGAAGRVLVDNPELVFPVPVGWRGDNEILTLTMKPDLTWQLMWVDARSKRTSVLKSLEWRVDELARAVNLSPDGRYIVYSALATNPFAPNAQAPRADRQLFVIAADGRSEAALTSGAGIYRHPVWTPDGTHVVYISDLSGTFDLWAIPVRDGRAAGQPKLLRKSVGDIVSLGMTDAGVYHYFSARSGVHRASIVPLGPVGSRAQAGGDKSDSRTTVESFVGQSPRWAPDGQSVALLRPRLGAAGVFDVVVRSLVDGAERVFREEPLVEQRPTWFPDGRSLLLLSSREQQQWWVRLDVASGRFTTLASQSDAQKGSGGVLVRSSAVMAADGRTVYFAASSSSTKLSIGRIDRVVALDLESGQVRTQVTVPGDDDTLPFVTQGVALALSPDGRTLAIASRGKSTTRLARIDLDGAHYRELTSGFTNDTLTNTLAWSRGGQWIVLVDRTGSDGARVMRVSPDGGAPEFTGVRVAGLRNFDLSPDGTRVVYDTSMPEGAGMLHSTLDVRTLLASRP